MLYGASLLLLLLLLMMMMMMMVVAMPGMVSRAARRDAVPRLM